MLKDDITKGDNSRYLLLLFCNESLTPNPLKFRYNLTYLNNHCH